MLKNKFFEAIRYLIVGLVCQSIDLFITLIFLSIVNNLFLANSFGYLIASTIAYFLHLRYTFKSKSRKYFLITRILKFISACFLGIILGFIILKILINLGIGIKIAKIIQLLLIAFSQYIFNSLITFRK